MVTGASRGVGYQIASALGLEGCRLIVHGRTTEGLAPVRAKLLDLGCEVHALPAELADTSQVDRLIDAVLERIGAPDIVYNNAAIMTPWREAHTTPLDDYRLSFQVNVLAPIRICDRLLGPMRARRWGRIVNVTSGIEHIRELLPYSVSKAALDRYVRDVSPSLEGSGVVMSLLDPGWLRTDMGGEGAPNSVNTVLPGALVPVFLPDESSSGRLVRAQDHRDAGATD